MNGPDKIDCFGDLVDFAEKHGFVDNTPEGEWSTMIAEALETEAVEFLVEHKIPFVYDGD